MKKIIVDMMGGDLAPVETVKGVALAAKELSAEFRHLKMKPQTQISFGHKIKASCLS